MLTKGQKEVVYVLQEASCKRWFTKKLYRGFPEVMQRLYGRGTHVTASKALFGHSYVSQAQMSTSGSFPSSTPSGYIEDTGYVEVVKVV